MGEVLPRRGRKAQELFGREVGSLFRFPRGFREESVETIGLPAALARGDGFLRQRGLLAGKRSGGEPQEKLPLLASGTRISHKWLPFQCSLPSLLPRGGRGPPAPALRAPAFALRASARHAVALRRRPARLAEAPRRRPGPVARPTGWSRFSASYS